MRGHQLVWSDSGIRVLEPCPVCQAVAGEDLVAVADTGRGADLSFARCGRCRSVYLRTQDRHIAHDEGLDDALFLTWYLEAGAGLEAMLPPLLAHPWRPGTSMLDVGCGYGFSAWYVQDLLGGRVVGLERASYGARGGAELGVEVRAEYLAGDTVVRGGPFDVVHCSEVVEHVNEPSRFLRSLRSATTDQGRLVLTTPDADAITADRPAAEVVEALSPGLHRFLLAPDHLQSLLREAGFEHQHLVRNGAHAVVWASPAPLEAPDWREVDPDELLKALRRLSATDDPALARGIAYRSLRTLVQLGRLVQAREDLAHLRQLLLADFSLDPLAFTGEAVIRYLATTGPDDRIGVWPSFLGPLLFWIGMLETLDDPGDVATRTRLFADAVTVMRHDVATGHRYAHEAAWLVERARFHLLQVAAQTVAREAPVLLGEVPDDLPVSAGAHAGRTREELALLRRDTGAEPVASSGGV